MTKTHEQAPAGRANQDVTVAGRAKKGLATSEVAEGGGIGGEKIQCIY